MKNSTLSRFHRGFSTKSEHFKIENKIISLLFTASVFILIFSFYVLVAQDAFASETSGTIVSGDNNGYAWSNQSGWVNFGCSNCGISITDFGITGYAWNNNYGWINMKPTNGGVTVAANGALSGYAWDSSLGWINFSGVSINSSGKFTGQASGTTVGTLTFDCTNCSVTTDFRPQNFRATPQSASSGGGGEGGGGGGGISYVSGPDGKPISAHISAFNVPMRLYPAQSGILTQGLTNQKSVVLDVPTNVFSDEIIFIVEEETVSIAPTAKIQVIGNALFNVFAVDKNGNRAQTFEKPIKITFIIPDSLRGRSDLAVYFFDETASVWIKISDTVFGSDSVSFSVDHLTLFAIFAGSELSPAIEAPFQLPPQFQFEIPQDRISAPSEGVGAPTEEATTTEITSEEKPPLFDIEVKPGTLESKSKTNRVVIVILIIAGIAAAIYVFLEKRRSAKQRDEI